MANMILENDVLFDKTKQSKKKNRTEENMENKNKRERCWFVCMSEKNSDWKPYRCRWDVWVVGLHRRVTGFLIGGVPIVNTCVFSLDLFRFFRDKSSSFLPGEKTSFIQYSGK